MDKETTEIAKLTGRISKDPKSKLFVPLAEEYKKAGDIEMAIHVLLEGLKNNPEYVTARSSLGKLFLAKGDLSGARKEFEDVVKTTPDNFMAQKKLGDVFILQNSPQDALSHYKIALSLNPGDGELASLISDVEAGRDIRTTIQPLKAKTNVQHAIKQEPPAAGADPLSVTGPASPQLVSVEQTVPVETPSVPQAVSPAPPADTAPAYAMTEAEAPEEVLVVEPLEPEASSQEPPTAGIDLQEAHELSAVPSVVPEESFDLDFQAGNQLPDEPVASRDVRTEAELFNVGDGGTIPEGAAEEIAEDKIFETKPGEEVPENIPGPSFEDIPGKSDDFTTDTLAELYISQGFFEKAVEIYERMLVDKPSSRGLQEKLSWVRDAVARTAAPASEQNKEVDIPAPQGARGYVPAAGTGEVFAVEPMEEYRPQQKEDAAVFEPEAVIGAVEYIPSVDPEDIQIEDGVEVEPDESWPGNKSAVESIVAGSGEYKPASEPKEQTIAGEEFHISVASSAQEQAGPKRDFEPREYVPRATEMEPLKQAPDTEHETGVPLIAGRKETIARLETWLTTIKKEK